VSGQAARRSDVLWCLPGGSDGRSVTADLGVNRTCGRFVGARWSILVSLSDVDGRARTAGRTIESEHRRPLGFMRGSSPLLGGRALVPLVYAGEWVGCGAIGMPHALAGGRLGDVVRATCCPPVGCPFDAIVWNNQSSYRADCSTRAASRPEQIDGALSRADGEVVDGRKPGRNGRVESAPPESPERNSHGRRPTCCAHRGGCFDLAR
jgi:hypothetical protein